jgi:hypothetical protein
MTQSQRWGKVVTTMPVPEGIISTSTGPVDPNDAVLDAVIAEAVEEIATEEYLPEEENDLQ